jgi:hypothetical protein
MTDYALSTQQVAVICALSSGATMTRAAEESGVHRNTINNWRRNSIPFQHALAHAQYDLALHFREKVEALFDLAIENLQAILTDPTASPSVRLKAALAVIQAVTTPPPPKKQVLLDIEKISYTTNPEPQTMPEDPPPPVHNIAQAPPQTIRRETPKIGRNDACPCGSGQKYKRCCLNKPAADPWKAAA